MANVRVEGHNKIRKGPHNCRAWLVYYRYCQKMTTNQIAVLSGVSSDTIVKRSQQLEIPWRMKRRPSQNLFKHDEQLKRPFLPAEKLSYLICLRQAKRKGMGKRAALQMIAQEHHRGIDFVLEKLGGAGHDGRI